MPLFRFVSTTSAVLAAVLLAAPGAALAKPAKPAAKAKVEVSTASTGSELTQHAPSTAPLTLQTIAERFAETDAKINTLKAAFRQSVRMEGSDVVQTVEGDITFKKPDLLRLTHKIPEPQTVVSDGTYLWVHRNSTNQVIQSRLDAWRKSEPLAQGLLDFGKSADMLTKYKTEIATVSAPGADGHRTFVLNLRPKTVDKKDEASDFLLTLKASTKDFFPGDATLKVGRTSIRSVFEGVRLNPDVPESAFKFTPPPEADLFKSPEPK